MSQYNQNNVLDDKSPKTIVRIAKRIVIIFLIVLCSVLLLSFVAYKADCSQIDSLKLISNCFLQCDQEGTPQSAPHENEVSQGTNEALFEQLFDWKASEISPTKKTDQPQQDNKRPFFSWFKNEKPSQNEELTQKEKEIEKELTKALDATWNFRGLSSLSSLDDYKKNDDIKSLLEQKKGGEILILGNVPNDEREKWNNEFKDMDDEKLIRFHKIVNSLFELQLKSSSDEKNMDSMSQIFSAIFENEGKIELPESMSSEQGWNKEIPQPKFLFAYDSDSPFSDLKHAIAVKYLLKTILEKCICDKTKLSEITTLSKLFDFYDETLKNESNVKIVKYLLVEKGLNNLDEDSESRQPLNDLLQALKVPTEESADSEPKEDSQE